MILLFLKEYQNELKLILCLGPNKVPQRALVLDDYFNDNDNANRLKLFRNKTTRT